MIEDFPIKPRYQKRFAVNIVSAFRIFKRLVLIYLKLDLEPWIRPKLLSPFYLYAVN